MRYQYEGAGIRRAVRDAPGALGLWRRADGERYRVNLCESCFFAALAFLKQERRTQNLFSDEQPCEERPFGLVARDDHFGDS